MSSGEFPGKRNFESHGVRRKRSKDDLSLTSAVIYADNYLKNWVNEYFLCSIDNINIIYGFQKL
jgi:hypothetical protein